MFGNKKVVRLEVVNNGRRAFIGRALMTAAAIASIASVQGCGVSKSGSTTTITLNVDEVVDYANAILSFASTAVNESFVASAMGPTNLALANTAIKGLTSAIAAFKEAAGSSTSITYDSTSAKTAFDSILSDAEQIGTLIIATINNTASDLSSTVVSDAKTAAGAAETLIDLLKAMVDMSSSKGRATLGSITLSTARGSQAIAQIAAFSAAVKK